MQGDDAAIQAWIANLISRRVAPYFTCITCTPYQIEDLHTQNKAEVSGYNRCIKSWSRDKWKRQNVQWKEQ